MNMLSLALSKLGDEYIIMNTTGNQLLSSKVVCRGI